MLRGTHFLLLAPLALMPAQGQESNADLVRQISELRGLVEALQTRVSQLEKQVPAAAKPAAALAAVPQSNVTPQPPDTAPGTTINVLVDGYYGYNFNAPIGRANRLRAYDVSSNSFSLNQAALVVENAADPEKGKRWGARLDLQWGQATQTLQGNPLNEPRPEIYRAVFQAYGTYVIPVGSGLTVDFGKWASSLGIEGNYTKDQMNYSRSYWFNFLPFYHTGVRASYKFNDWMTGNYWVTNGTEQTEAFNGFKDELAGAVIQPRKNLSWTLNYYHGQEHPDVIFYPYGGAPPNLPDLQGVPFQAIPNPPTGRLHIVDTYATWQTTPKLTLAGEADWVLERLYLTSAPDRAAGGAGYAQYQLSDKLSLAARGEYLSDRGALFSGVSQLLKEATLTAKYKFGEGFEMYGEWRRDFSNHPYFYTSTPGVLSNQQNTATVGLVWWFGPKQGVW